MLTHYERNHNVIICGYGVRGFGFVYVCVCVYVWWCAEEEKGTQFTEKVQSIFQVRFFNQPEERCEQMYYKSKGIPLVTNLNLLFCEHLIQLLEKWVRKKNEAKIKNIC